MKNLLILSALLLLTGCKTPVKFVPKVPIPETQVTRIAETPDLSHAESVAYDENYNRLYVSIQGEQEPGDGGIATIDLRGKLINKEFTTGLNNPKGIAVSDQWIFVSDVTELVKINRQTGVVSQKYAAGDEQFLNDVAIDDAGNVYVSDMRSSSIYKLDTDDNYSKWLTTTELENPNGLLAVGNDLYVAGWGLPGSENAEGNTQGRFLKVDLTTKKVTQVTTTTQGNLDGIQIYDDYHFLVSDWRKGTILKISKAGEVTPFLTSEASLGDLLYIREKKLLALPLNRQNKVQLYSVNQ